MTFSHWIAAGFTAAALLIAGCTPGGVVNRTVEGEQPDPLPELERQPEPADVTLQIQEMNRLTNQLIENARQLPGATEQAHRDGIERVFRDFELILPRLAPREHSGAFQTRLRTVRDGRSRMARAVPDQSVDSIIDNTLHALHGALLEVKRRSYVGHEGIRRSLNQLEETIRELDAVRGPLHRLVATRAVRYAGQTVRQMVDELIEEQQEQPDNGEE